MASIARNTNDTLEDPWGPPSSSQLSSSSSPVLASTTVALSDSAPDSPSINEEVAVLEDPEDIINDETKSIEEKGHILQKMLFSASSNGDVDKVHDLLGGSTTQNFVDVNTKDDSGSTALIYSSCFGHDAVVGELLRFGALPDEQDKHEWTALMWAINNSHLSIVRQLVEHGASVTLKTSTGRSALNFVSPQSEIYKYLEQNGYTGGDTSTVSQDFYHQIRDPTEVEEELSKQLMMQDAVLNLDVDLAHLNIEESTSDFYGGGGGIGGGIGVGAVGIGLPGVNDIGDEDYQEFLWERCLPDQMFVFNISDIPRILNIAITDIQPQRSRSQKPVPANMIFLSARYAHYHCNEETLEHLLDPVVMRIRNVIMEHKQDLAFLAFWLSNCSLLLYYLRKDFGLQSVTIQFQEELSELISDIYLLITQDVELRLEKVLDVSILDHETIPGLDTITYQSDWKIFKSKGKQLTHKEEVDQVTKPPSPKRKALPSPRNITSILSSVLFVMDLYDVHPIITQQIVSQILYWLGAVLFNRIMTNRKYLARSRAMQIRLNVSAIEDWARANNRQPEDIDEFGNTVAAVSAPAAIAAHMSISELCRKHFSALVQILQWLQCFTGFGDDFTNVVATLQQLKDLNPLQLLHVAKKYRAEVGEKGLSKEYKAYLGQLAIHHEKQYTHHATVDKVRAKNVGIRPALEVKNELKSAVSLELKKQVKEDQKPENEVKQVKELKAEVGQVNQDEVKKEIVKEEKEVKEGKKEVSEEAKDGKKEEISKEDKNTSEIQDKKEISKPEKKDDVSPVVNNEEQQPVQPSIAERHDSEDDSSNKLDVYLDASEVLPFVIPTLREMIVTWGAGLGGTNKQRARRYEPSLPTEVLDKFDMSKEEAEEQEQEYSRADMAERNNTSIFQDLAVPEPSVHKGWGEDPSVDDLDAGWQ